MPRLPCLLVPLLAVTGAAEPPPPAIAPPAQWSHLGSAWAGSSINVVANRRHAVFSDGTYQFASYYDSEGRMVLARRRSNSPEWHAVATPHRGTVADAHNTISLAVDGAGYLHVAWDHHGQPLNYARSLAPHALELEPPRSMTGEAEDQVTYPEFHRLPDGDLLCLYRDGQSGRGRLVLKRYDHRARSWSMLHSHLIDGEDERSPYWGATVDRFGRLHLAWIWRDTPDVRTNHDLAYALSPDGGRSWQTVAGEPRPPPFTATSSDYAARIPTGHNLMNSPWVTTDEAGQPYICSYWSEAPEAPPQFRVVYRSAQQWQQAPITARTQAFTLAGTATKRPPISRGVLLVGGDTGSRVTAHLIYRDDAQDGRAILRSTDDLAGGRWQEQPLTLTSLDAWEPVIDPVRWSSNHVIDLLVQVAHQRDGDDHRGAKTPPSPIGILSVPTDRVGNLGLE